MKNTIEKIRKFRDDREWMQFHDPKNMAIGVVLEATELLEHFQWKDKKEAEEYVADHKEEVSDEIADVAIYLVELADNLGIDLEKAMEAKLAKNALKYPIEKSRGRTTKYNKL